MTKDSVKNKLRMSEAVAPIDFMMPTSKIRLSAGRVEMSEEMQAMCFMAGANSIHFGEKLLMTANPEKDKDLKMLKNLGLKAIQHAEARIN